MIRFWGADAAGVFIAAARSDVFAPDEPPRVAARNIFEK
jgi:hypothetical protein